VSFGDCGQIADAGKLVAGVVAAIDAAGQSAP